MLQELSIRNFAIIEDLRIRLGKGLTILSGETGAGKSIIIHAVNLLLGSRASAALIRTGADSAELEALFEVPRRSRVADTMSDLGYDPNEGLLVRRIISSSDRHRIYINGRLATMQSLADITAHLASISGQHAHQKLLKEEEHLMVLDQFGDALALRAEFGDHHARMMPLIREEQALLGRRAHQEEQVALLRFQQEEIQSAAVSPAEDEALEKERLRLKNGEALYQTVAHCIETLYSDDGSVVERLGETAKGLARMGRMDDQLASRAAELEALTFRVEDVTTHLRDYLQTIDLDSQRMEAVEARLDRLNKLKRKYGGSLQAVLGHAVQIDHQLNAFETLDDDITRVRAELERAQQQLCRLAGDLSARRRKAARALAVRVEQELAGLKMAGTCFAVDLRPVAANGEVSRFLRCGDHGLTETGAERAVFMIAPNVGEAIKPLIDIASGGELSRVVLALKSILARGDALETVVFDEVDAGIGGGAADGVGQKLAELARHHQVLCITHLPQIARYGDHHLRIAKVVSGGRTRTTISPLTADERVAEIARMLGGDAPTAATMKHARELLGNQR